MEYRHIARVQALVSGGWKSAPASLVKLLHDPDSGPEVLTYLTEGLSYILLNSHSYPSARSQHLSFARICFKFGRADAVRAIVEAGTPAWLRDLPAEQRRRTLPRESTPKAWFDALCCYRPRDDSPVCFISAYHFACEPVGAHTAAFLELALDFDPESLHATKLAEHSVEGAAVLAQVQMNKLITGAQKSLAVPASADVCAAPAPRRRCRSL